jgi:hypothetical protein
VAREINREGQIERGARRRSLWRGRGSERSGNAGEESEEKSVRVRERK